MPAGDQIRSMSGRDLCAGRTAVHRGAVVKPQYLAKVKDLDDHQSKVDAVFYCGKPGVPRIGPPRKIVQLPAEVIFFYEDISGDPYRIIPIDGRPHRANANPSHYGDSVARWEGAVLVVDARNFVEETWFGEYGYFHSSEMRVVERLWKDGDNLVWQATVEDPVVLMTPWVAPPRVVTPSTEPLEESPKCVETDGAKLSERRPSHPALGGMMMRGLAEKLRLAARFLVFVRAFAGLPR